MKFLKPGYSFWHPSASLLENWKMALHDPLFIVLAVVLILLWVILI